MSEKQRTFTTQEWKEIHGIEGKHLVEDREDAHTAAIAQLEAGYITDDSDARRLAGVEAQYRENDEFARVVGRNAIDYAMIHGVEGEKDLFVVVDNVINDINKALLLATQRAREISANDTEPALRQLTRAQEKQIRSIIYEVLEIDESDGYTPETVGVEDLLDGTERYRITNVKNARQKVEDEERKISAEKIEEERRAKLAARGQQFGRTAF
ncbi:MAG: hypothetical protein MUF85_01435 [Patescibacteria group bacterium]|jgi:uncharacterized protein (UPF0297 family)|nr:hypothetical protein [Patescibacteria group bacterium]